MRKCSKVMKVVSIMMFACAFVILGVMGGNDKVSAKSKATLKNPVIVKTKKVTVKDEGAVDFYSCIKKSYHKGKPDQKGEIWTVVTSFKSIKCSGKGKVSIKKDISKRPDAVTDAGATWGDYILTAKKKGSCTITAKAKYKVVKALTAEVDGHKLKTLKKGTKKIKIKVNVKSVFVKDKMGLYNAKGKQVTCWNQLVKDGDITVKKGIIQEGSGLEGELRIPSSITGIGADAFAKNEDLTGVLIPSSVKSIGSGAFLGCTTLSSVTLPDGITAIKDDSFYGCSSLANITIPASVKSIGESAFRDCSSLTSIVIPNGVTTISESTFDGCSKLSSVTIPDSVKTIDLDAFSGCSSLASVKVPSSVTSIVGDVFDEVTIVYYNGSAEGAPWGAKEVKAN